MKLLDLVIVDDEPILLKGLLKTYDWDQMGFQVVGTALSGEQAIEVIREKKPDVVLTDIRMKQMTGLQMMDTIQQTGQECLFVVLSAYRDFEYAKEACDLGAFAYLLKPIEDDKLQETMQNAYRSCMEKQKKEQSAARIFRFSSLSMVESFAQSLSLEKTIPSKLYQEEDTGMWYLMVKKGKLKLEEYIDVCEHLGEYGVLCSKQPYVDQYCKEHYRCIIPKHALKKIKEYV